MNKFKQKMKNTGLVALIGASLAFSSLNAKADSTNITETITNNITTTINWEDQYLLDVQKNNSDGFVTGSNTNGYWPTNTIATFTATPSNSIAKKFDHWNSPAGIDSNATLNLTLDQARTNYVAVFVPMQYSWTVNSKYTNGVDGLSISPGTTNFNYGSTPVQTINKTILDLGNGKRAVYKDYTKSP